MLLQSLKPLLPGAGWQLVIAQVPEMAHVATTRESAFQFFELLRTVVTGGRPLPVTIATTDDTSPSMMDLLRERAMGDRLALEVFLDLHEMDAWVVVPDMFFQTSGHLGPGPSLPQ